ncbi:DUF4376 domain-containing protein [Methylosinus sp. Ce-a6]|uniref:DUF4376 domain-containing protein n=1 Tax=Methylosinus sp. Ce-a6 TaxID=2172005 RepID=UPI00135C7B6E|nr:DUF4376 domain-containing protein [Methylosinus sp. Ce-a6]
MSYSLLAGSDCVRRDADGALIPPDPGNRDYRAFLSWVAVGNAATLPEKPTLAELKAERRAALVERRRRAETAGTRVNGMSMSTDEKTQAKLTAAVVASVLDNAYAVNWKLADGSFALFDHAALIAAAQGVRAHVQNCFDREAQLAAAIDAAVDATALASIDIDAGWPA